MDSIWEILKGLVLTLVTAALVHFGAMNHSETLKNQSHDPENAESSKTTSQVTSSSDMPPAAADLRKSQNHPQNHPQKSKPAHHYY